MSSGIELSAVVFGQHNSPDLIPCDFFFFWGCLKDKVYNSTLQTEDLKENVHRKIANDPAE
jgi:hypothetical protein